MGALIAAIWSNALYRVLNQDDNEDGYSGDFLISSKLSIKQLSNRIIAGDIFIIAIMLSGICAFGYLMYDTIKTYKFVDVIIACIVLMIALAVGIAFTGKHLYHEIKDRESRNNIK